MNIDDINSLEDFIKAVAGDGYNIIMGDIGGANIEKETYEGAFIDATYNKCPANGQHFHANVVLKYLPEKTADVDESQYKIFESERDLEEYIRQGVSSGELNPTPIGEPTFQGGAMGVTMSLPSIVRQTSDGKLKALFDSEAVELIENSEPPPPKSTVIPDSDDMTDALNWIDAFAMVLAARNGINGHKYVLQAGAEVGEFVPTDSEHTLTPSQLLQTAVSAYGLNKMLLDQKSRRRVEPMEAINSTFPALAEFLGLGEFKYKKSEGSDGKLSFDVSHPILGENYNIELQMESDHGSETFFSLTYKKPNGIDVEYHDLGLIGDTFRTLIVNSLVEFLDREWDMGAQEKLDQTIGLFALTEEHKNDPLAILKTEEGSSLAPAL